MAEAPATQASVKYARGEHPNSLRNLHQWQKGTNGHQGSGPIVAPALRAFESLTLAQIRALDPEKLSPGKAIARYRILQAINPEAWKGGLEDAEFIADRTDGPVPRPGNALVEHADKVLLLTFDDGAPFLLPQNGHT